MVVWESTTCGSQRDIMCADRPPSVSASLRVWVDEKNGTCARYGMLPLHCNFTTDFFFWLTPNASRKTLRKVHGTQRDSKQKPSRMRRSSGGGSVDQQRGENILFKIAVSSTQVAKSGECRPIPSPPGCLFFFFYFFIFFFDALATTTATDAQGKKK
jgi:hypothetical protein